MKHVPSLSSLAGVVILAACAGHQPPVQTGQIVIAPDSVQWNGDPDLAPILVRREIGPQELKAAEALQTRLGAPDLINRLGDTAEDTTVPWLVRVNALRLLSNAHAVEELPLFRDMLASPDERLRIAAVSGLQEFLPIREATASAILTEAMHDPSPNVQIVALQVYGDRDPVPVRSLMKTARDANVKKIATDLVQAAEERGAPLEAIDSAGTLVRVAAAGPTLTFRPTRKWPQWHAAVGELYVTPAGAKKPQLIASGVEAVANVVPAFFTADGSTLVYEANREIYARDVRSGSDRKLADGVAPRILPFTNDVIFAVRETPGDTEQLEYNVMRIPAAGGTAASIGEATVTVSTTRNGMYVPLRWAKIHEQEGKFTLQGEGTDTFELPTPFGR